MTHHFGAGHQDQFTILILPHAFSSSGVCVFALIIYSSHRELIFTGRSGRSRHNHSKRGFWVGLGSFFIFFVITAQAACSRQKWDLGDVLDAVLCASKRVCN